MREEKGFVLSIIDNTGKSNPDKIILKESRKEALNVVKCLPDYSVDGKEISFSNIGCSCKGSLTEVPIIRAVIKVPVS